MLESVRLNGSETIHRLCLNLETLRLQVHHSLVRMQNARSHEGKYPCMPIQVEENITATLCPDEYWAQIQSGFIKLIFLCSSNRRVKLIFREFREKQSSPPPGSVRVLSQMLWLRTLRKQGECIMSVFYQHIFLDAPWMCIWVVLFCEFRGKQSSHLPRGYVHVVPRMFWLRSSAVDGGCIISLPTPFLDGPSFASYLSFNNPSCKDSNPLDEDSGRLKFNAFWIKPRVFWFC